MNQAGARRLRPLARRRRIIARPERVRIRARNPWTFLRRRRLGWNVRFIGSGVGRARSASRAERRRAWRKRGRLSDCPRVRYQPENVCGVRGSVNSHLLLAPRPPRPGTRLRLRLAAPRGHGSVTRICFVFGSYLSLVAVLDEIRPLCYIPLPRSVGHASSPRASDFCSVIRLERYGYSLFNRCG